MWHAVNSETPNSRVCDSEQTSGAVWCSMAAVAQSSVITAELEHFYAEEANADLTEDELLGWLNGSVIGFDGDSCVALRVDPGVEVNFHVPQLTLSAPPYALSDADECLCERPGPRAEGRGASAPW